MRGLLFLADRADVLRTVVEGLGARRTVVVSDAVAGLVGATGRIGPGAVAAGGHRGGRVRYRLRPRQWRRVDGWGHVLGDAGSPPTLGMAGLRAALRAHDGLPDGSAALLRQRPTRLGPPEGWPRLVMTMPTPPSDSLPSPPSSRRPPDRPGRPRPVRPLGTDLADLLLRAAEGLADPLLTATGGLLSARPVAEALDAAPGRAGAGRSPARGGPSRGPSTWPGTCATRGASPSTRHTSSRRDRRAGPPAGQSTSPEGPQRCGEPVPSDGVVRFTRFVPCLHRDPRAVRTIAVTLERF